MNGLELGFNDQLTGGFETRDLNDDPTIPYPDESFDIVTCVVSIDYLVQPVEVLKEIHRVLRPGGRVVISQSNRCFPSKAIAMVGFDLLPLGGVGFVFGVVGHGKSIVHNVIFRMDGRVRRFPTIMMMTTMMMMMIHFWSALRYI